MEPLSIERLRSPRSSQSIFNLADSASSTPFVSAPSSPRHCCYYSAPSTPRGRSSRKLEFEDDHRVAVPFAWEEKPGTPKRHQKTIFAASTPSSPTSTGYVTGFHLSAPVSPSPGIVYQPEDEFEFTSARMSEADSVGSFMSHADELFFQGQLLPLKLPPRLQQQQQQQQREFVQQSRSPTPPRSPRMTAARKESKAHQRAHSLFFSYEDQKKPASFAPVRPTPKAKRSLKELLHLSTQKKQSRSSSLSSTGSSGSSRFSSSRSSSTSSSSNKSSSRNSVSSRQVKPVSPGELLHYRRFASKNVEELRKKMFMPYKQGLLGWLGCLPARKQEV